VYVACLVWVDGSALTIRRLTGRFNLFHALAVLSLVMVVGGVAQVVLRRKIRRWLWRHYQYMSWSYAGLVAGAVNEALVRVPRLRDFYARAGGWVAVAASAAVVAGAAALIFGNQRRSLAAVGGVAGASAAVTE
jgi:hypothetical protein